jgi:hypothetical protein
MTVTERPHLSTTTAAPWVERLGRVGLIARGATYILIGFIALQMAFGDTARSASQNGAFHTVASQPFGEVLLWIIAAGLLGYALWQLIAAIQVHESDSAKAWGKRALYLVKTGIYIVLSWTAASIAMNAGSSGTSTTADIMKSDGGRLLIGAVGVAIVITGLVLAWKGWTTDFEKKLRTDQMSHSTYRVIRALGRIGYLARGIVFTLFGILVVYSAVTFTPKNASGLDEALQEVAQAPAGPILLTIVALGLIAFGLYSCTEAKYRRFEA